MAEFRVVDEIAAPLISSAGEMSRRRRILALVLLLSISFAHFIFSAFYRLLQPDIAINPYQRSIGVVSGIFAETTSLFLLWFVLSGQGRTWKDLGWNAKWSDLPQALGLVIGTLLLSRLATNLFQGVYSNHTGHYLQARSTHGILGDGISIFSIVFVLVNPFFEELIVRAYTMTEVIGLGGGSTAAIVVSVLVQMSYHLYQGFVRCIALTVTFAIFSIYFAKTRRIVPVILAHLWMDAYFLFTLRS